MEPADLSDKPVFALLDKRRLLILRAVWRCPDPLCGCDLTNRLSLSKNLLSYHIKTLREAGYLEETRCGQKKQYRIPDDRREKVQQILTVLEVI
ncbi:winged helix-turn-helix domain-containing protein [Patescibacteria group bacterium]|nr:winged helix-turn-helix domain-containing protein [Patescibacteria group bacterium]